MLRPDFSEIQENGFRVSQFRIFKSKKMQAKEFDRLKKGYVSSGDIIGERNLLIKYLIEQNEINFTSYYFSEKITFLLIFATLFVSVFNNMTLSQPIILGLLSIIFYIITYRKKVAFVMGNLGIDLAESIYNSKISSYYSP